jgi:glycosyltransferase involved in cell wall biosynthesis
LAGPRNDAKLANGLRKKLPVTVSIVIAWANRPELAVSLARNAALFEELDAEVIVSNCGGDVRQLEKILAEAQNERIRSIDCLSPAFNKCLAINAGVQASRGDVIFLLDADIVLNDGFAIPAGVAERRCFATLARVRDEGASAGSGVLSGVIFSLTFQFKNAPPLTVESGHHYVEGGGRTGPGVALIARADFEAVGGMDSRFSGWGFEDLDLIIRLQHFLGRTRVHANEALHIPHDDNRRNLSPGMSRLDSERRNRTLAFAKYAADDWMGTMATDAQVLMPA